MSSPGSQGRQLPTPPGAPAQPLDSSPLQVPASQGLQPPAPSPGTPPTSGRFQAPFSVEAILARPDPGPQRSFGFGMPASSSAGPDFWTALSPPPPRALPWVCPATWLPPCLSLGVCPLYPRPSVSRLPEPHFCSPQGPGVTGLGLAHCSGFWGIPNWAPTENLKSTTEKHPKRVRTLFNSEQLEELEKAFAKEHNIVGKERAQLAARIHLTENQVRIWFQNRRVKYQKQQRQNLPAKSATAASQDEPSSSSDQSIQDEDAESEAES